MCAGVWALSGCFFEPALPKLLNTYGTRLATLLEANAPPCCNTPSLPSIPTLENSAKEVTIELRTFYALRHCDVYSLVAERNTALGKLQSPSQRYLYELALLQGLARCQSQLNDNNIKAEIDTWIEQKQTQLPLSFANLMHSTEIRHSLALGNGYIDGEEDGLSQSMAGYQYLQSLRDPGPGWENNHKLETHLQQLQRQALPARMFRSSLLISEQLERITAMLHEQAPQCSTPQEKQKAEYLVNVFKLFFIDSLQPMAGKLNHYHHQLIPVLKKLTADNPNLGPLQLWIAARYQQDFSNYQDQWQKHVQWWQAFLKRCELKAPFPNNALAPG
ncbi:DUF3080 family protein [Aliiglaciecola sp. CAU 1673]|uniref:DUF3080 family protein n=1 Tax=Aliiglaciecola sp. CAU 1673 TaxID=3032595 RepID=UPI0023DB93AB|nr:DUF3080 family protein [Aliiglaciecola sp. CAU 1673]MDF2177604.1 DUF3080 family protein [Aliiglaciecola sp. CAU 1673]